MASMPSLEPLTKQVTIIVGLAVVSFMAFGLALSFYRNILFEEKLQALEEENRELAEEIRKSRRDLEYYTSSQYKDKYAKENLGLLGPGEKLLIIAKEDEPRDLSGEELSERERREVEYRELLRQMPILEHWKLFLFERAKLKELRKEMGMEDG